MIATHLIKQAGLKRSETAKSAKSAEVKERYRRMGATPFILKPTEYDAFLKSESGVAAMIIKAAKIRVQ